MMRTKKTPIPDEVVSNYTLLTSCFSVDKHLIQQYINYDNQIRVRLGDGKQLKGLTQEYYSSNICAGCMNYSAPTKQ